MNNINMNYIIKHIVKSPINIGYLVNFSKGKYIETIISRNRYQAKKFKTINEAKIFLNKHIPNVWLFPEELITFKKIIFNDNNNSVRIKCKIETKNRREERETYEVYYFEVDLIIVENKDY